MRSSTGLLLVLARLLRTQAVHGRLGMAFADVLAAGTLEVHDPRPDRAGDTGATLEAALAAAVEALHGADDPPDLAFLTRVAAVLRALSGGELSPADAARELDDAAGDYALRFLPG